MRIVRILFSLKETIKIEAIDLLTMVMKILMMRLMMKVGKDLKTIDDKSVVAVVLAEKKTVSEMKTWTEAREIQIKMLRRLVKRWKVNHQ
jgi:hypothetical protein